MPKTEEYRIVRELVTGAVHIEENTQYHDIQADEVCVHEGVRARLFGTVKNKITVKKNSKIFIHGSFKGEVINEGGRIYIFET
jgi:hypothetical protein